MLHKYTNILQDKHTFMQTHVSCKSASSHQCLMQAVDANVLREMSKNRLVSIASVL